MENALIAVSGCGVGVAIAVASRDALVAIMPYTVRRTEAIAIDWRVLLFSAALAVCTVLITGLVPSLRSSSVRPVAILTAGGSQTTTRGHRRLGSMLVTAEVAFALVVLAFAGLLIGSFLRLTATNPGFDTTNVATFRLDLPRRSTAFRFKRQLESWKHSRRRPTSWARP